MKNGEKYAEVKERVARFGRFCDANDCETCRLGGDDCGLQACGIRWLDLEAEVEKPLPCPFCGGEVFVGSAATYTDGDRRVQMKCRDDDNCGYCGPMRLSEEDAVAAHNRVAKAARRGADAARKDAEGGSLPQSGTLDCDSCSRRGECRVSFEPRIPGPDEDGHDEGCLDWAP